MLFLLMVMFLLLLPPANAGRYCFHTNLFVCFSICSRKHSAEKPSIIILQESVDRAVISKVFLWKMREKLLLADPSLQRFRSTAVPNFFLVSGSLLQAWRTSVHLSKSILGRRPLSFSPATGFQVSERPSGRRTNSRCCDLLHLE